MRQSFLAKIAVAVALIALATILFYGHWFGATLGLFALCWIVAGPIRRAPARPRTAARATAAASRRPTSRPRH